MADHFFNSDDEPIVDDTLDEALQWLREYASNRQLDLESHYSAWNLRWIDQLGNDRSVQVSATDRPRPRLGIYPLSWFDEEYGPGAQRRHAHLARHFHLNPPFTRELFESTLELAFHDAAATDPSHAPAFCSDLTWSLDIEVYRKSRPVH